MIFPANDFMGLQKAGLLELCYRCHTFAICKVAQWAYMAVIMIEDTTMDEDEPSRVTLAAWHVDSQYAQRIMADNNHFAATMLHKDHGKEPDLVVTVSHDQNPLADIRNEVQNRLRKPIEDPVLDRIFKEQETQRLKAFLDRYGEHPQFSPKKVWIGMVLLLLYPLGLPFFYFNKPLWGGMMLGAFIVGCVFTPLLILGGLLGCVLIVMTLMQVLGNKVTDKQGLLICTQKDQQLILESIAKYQRNVAELAAEEE